MWFLKGSRRKNQNQDDPFQVLERLKLYFEEAKKELEGASKPAPRQVMVVRRELDLAKPINLLVGFLILAAGFGIGHWSKSQDYNRGYLDQLVSNESGGMILITPGAIKEAESALAPTLSAPVVSQAAVKDSALRHSSQDTLLQKVRDLLERVKKGE